MRKYIRPSVVIKRFNEEHIISGSVVTGEEPDKYLDDYKSDNVRLRQVNYDSVFGYKE